MNKRFKLSRHPTSVQGGLQRCVRETLCPGSGPSFVTCSHVLGLSHSTGGGTPKGRTPRRGPASACSAPCARLGRAKGTRHPSSSPFCRLPGTFWLYEPCGGQSLLHSRVGCRRWKRGPSGKEWSRGRGGEWPSPRCAWSQVQGGGVEGGPREPLTVTVLLAASEDSSLADTAEPKAKAIKSHCPTQGLNPALHPGEGGQCRSTRRGRHFPKSPCSDPSAPLLHSWTRTLNPSAITGLWSSMTAAAFQGWAHPGVAASSSPPASSPSTGSPTPNSPAVALVPNDAARGVLLCPLLLRQVGSPGRGWPQAKRAAALFGGHAPPILQHLWAERKL